MSKSVYFVLGVHSHQPVGNFDHVFQEALDRAYLPFLEKLVEHPAIKVSLHFSGVLLEWILQHHPQFGEILKALVKRNQVEMMSGGFYEPILPIIPDEDKRGQIRLYNSFLKEHTGYEPTGLWLAERVWEPHLPKVLKSVGIKYTVVDDLHFKCTGLLEEDTFGYYVTEELGEEIAVFPSNEKLRYLIPFEDVKLSLEFFRDVATEDGQRILVLGDDGEKFGVWPGTYHHCYKYGWLDDFFKMIEDNADLIKMATFSEVLGRLEPLGKVYLPTASYREMMEWVMPLKSINTYERLVEFLKEEGMYDDVMPFVRGGFWRGFFSKYPESNNLHKKMLYVNRKIYQYAQAATNRSLVEKALLHLWQGQCNCGYWHGVFGGLYLPHLRSALYRNLIEAEKTIEQGIPSGQGKCIIKQFDFDVDGREEIILETDRQNLYLKPSYGGALFEHDIKSVSLNLLDTMSRKEEAYHANVRKVDKTEQPDKSSTTSIHHLLKVKEKGLDRLLYYDWHRRVSLLDHFPRPGTTLEKFASSSYLEDGDFVLEPYEVRKVENDGEVCRVTLSRDGNYRKDGFHTGINLTKTLLAEVGKDEYSVYYHLENMSHLPVVSLFGIEFNVNLLAGRSPDRYYFVEGVELGKPQLITRGEHQEVEVFGIEDEWLKLRIEFSVTPRATLWRFPIETVSVSEGGFERVYQGSVFFPFWSLNLEGNGKARFSISCRTIKYA